MHFPLFLRARNISTLRFFGGAGTKKKKKSFRLNKKDHQASQENEMPEQIHPDSFRKKIAHYEPNGFFRKASFGMGGGGAETGSPFVCGHHAR